MRRVREIGGPFHAQTPPTLRKITHAKNCQFSRKRESMENITISNYLLSLAIISDTAWPPGGGYPTTRIPCENTWGPTVG